MLNTEEIQNAINRGIATRIFRSGQSDDFTGDPIFAPDPVSDPSNPSTSFPAVVGTNSNNFEFDGLSRLTYATDNNDPDETDDDSEVSFAYDSLSRVIEETQQIGDLPVQVTSSGYEADTRVSVTYPNGRRLNYTYDGLDRIKSITDDGEALALVEYDYIGVGRVLERRSPTNGTRMTYLNDAGDTDIGYDGLRRTVTLRHLEADNTLIVGFEYGYDRMNNRTFQRKLHDLANSELYEYDSVYRLINFERGELNAPGDAIITPSTEVNQGQEWNLDGVGNWDESTIIDENGNPIVDDREHSSFNELITQEGATLLYDDNGNLVEDENYTYQYDSRNRLRIATRKADGVVAEYSYDAMGRRIRKEVSNSGTNDGVTDFYYDGQRVVEERDGSNVLTQQFVYGNYIDEVLVMDRNLDGDDSAISAGDQRFHYHQDAQFSVYAVTDENGDIEESYLYDPYGEVTVFDASGNIVPDNAWGTANSLIDNPYLFTGRRFDEETGLYYFRARYFDADQGRFISRDPIGYVDGMNLYQAYFVPSGVDPLGLRITDQGEDTFPVDADPTQQGTIQGISEELRKAIQNTMFRVPQNFQPVGWGGATYTLARDVLNKNQPKCLAIPCICGFKPLYICKQDGVIEWFGFTVSFVPQFQNTHLLSPQAQAWLQTFENQIRQHENARRAIDMFFFGTDYPVFGIGIDCDQTRAKKLAEANLLTNATQIVQDTWLWRNIAHAALGLIPGHSGIPQGPNGSWTR